MTHQTKKTGFYYHELCMWHDPGNHSMFDSMGLNFQPATAYENAETKRRLKNLLDVSGISDQLDRRSAEKALKPDLLRFHTESYINQLEVASSQGPGEAGDCATFAKGAYEIACLSAGMAIDAVEAVLTGELKNAYVLTRPPGHHASSDKGCGFCLLGNIPIAVLSAMDKGLVNRVAVVDWDVHHGNGTQEAFYDRDDVLTISIHHENNYPLNSGSVAEQGKGKGTGYNLNIPLPAGSGTGAYQGVIEQLVIPALRNFKPDLIIVACGFDASALDPLGPMILNSESYRVMTQSLMDCAQELCADRLVFTHEGGYSETYVPYCGLATIEALSDTRSGIKDLIGEEIAQWGQQEIMPHQQDVINRIKPLLNNILSA